MARIIPSPGTYNAKRNDAIIVREEESGAVMAYVAYAIVGANVSFSDTHAVCLVSRDGTPQKNNILTLKKCFPAWDGTNPFELETIELAEGEEPEFELADCFHDTFTPRPTEENPEPTPIQTFKAQWLNAVGGGRPKKEPMTAADQKRVITKYGSKFKALFAAAPASTKATTAPAKAAPAAPAAKPVVSGPPGRKPTEAVARTSTQEEVWNDLVERDGESDETIQKYYDACDSVVAGSSADPAALTPTNWGAVAVVLGM